MLIAVAHISQTHFKLLIRDAVQSADRFSNNWSGKKETAPIDFSQSFTIGNQVKFLGRPLGFIVGFRYANSYRYDNESEANRAFVDAQGESGIAWAADQEVSRITNGWSALT